MARTLPPKKKAAAPGAPNGSEGNTDMPAALRIAAATLGARATISKPFHVHQLLTLIQTHLAPTPAKDTSKS